MMVGAQPVAGGTWFRLWAPRPRTLEIEVAGLGRFALPRSETGWVEGFVPGARPGARYLYVLDGDRRRPDPASRSQPDGVHAASEIVDPNDFAWHDQSFRPAPWHAFYELHVGSFSAAGTFAGVEEQIGRLVALGVDVVELMPVASFPGRRNWGYDGTHWLAPHAAYGGPHGLRQLVDACHARGLAVVLDVVLNHLGPEGNYLAEFGPYFSSLSTPWGPALDLDSPSAGPVRSHVIACARSLVEEYHLDGLRLDAVHAFTDHSPLHIVAELAATLHADAVRRGRPIWVIAESDLGETRAVEPAEEGGWGCDAMWADDFHHALHAVLTSERHSYYVDFGAPSQLARVLERGFYHSGHQVAYRGRRYGEPAAHLDGRRLIACTQNHDQVGNRARGERLAVLAPGCTHAAAALLLTSPFTPFLFMGEEQGEVAPFPYFTSFEDRALARAVTEGRIREQGAGTPDPQAIETFLSARVTPRPSQDRDVTAFYTALLGWRRKLPSLGQQAFDRTEAEASGATLIVRRGSPWEETLVVARLADSEDTVALPAARHGDWRLLLDAGDYGHPPCARRHNDRLTIAGYGAVLLAAP